MDNLLGFFAQSVGKIETEKFQLSSRFKVGNDILNWEIGCITAMENNSIRKQCLDYSGRFDGSKYQSLLLSRCIIFPDLNNMALQNSYNVKSSEELIAVMLSPGEFEFLCDKVLKINGFKSEEELVNTVKN
ncbi:MAG: phage portal protein [Clostridia bacterium]